MSKSTAKKPTTTKASKANGKPRKPNPLHEKLVKLLTRPNGANITDIQATKFKYPAINALRIAERRGYKTSIVKKPGELSRYGSEYHSAFMAPGDTNPRMRLAALIAGTPIGSCGP